MHLDRDYQRELLTMLAESYPRSHDIRQLFSTMDDDAMQRYAANLVYLEEHGLADSAIKYGLDGHMSSGLPRITAKGMDFLADDGGLSAILGVVTVKLHEDTLKELIGQRIAESDLPTPEKSRLLDQLKSLPGEAIKHLTLKLVDAGLSNWPAALQAIETFAHRAI
ncbi:MULTISPECIES: hypothetical protein [Burkholderia cepacia complex]|uniref:hypothetical protein n=1 Tax=Burkholderia cepacia complex TaxID=87882 RepID=UPI00158EC3C6|nr:MULTISPECIES: hypothetical protein [Burkholderia cepacia complex]MCA8051301.1 hypothetical protein [Burkholderia arboris]